MIEGFRFGGTGLGQIYSIASLGVSEPLGASFLPSCFYASFTRYALHARKSTYVVEA